MKRILAAATIGALAGTVAAGVIGAALGAAAGVAGRALLDRRAWVRLARSASTQVPEVLLAIAAAVRAGRSVPQALEAARDEAPQPIRAALVRACARLQVGAPLDDALEHFAREVGSAEARAAADTIGIAASAGGNLPMVLDASVTAMAERARIDRDRRAAAAQAKMSGAVVGAMPLAFVVIAGPTAREQLTFLFREPIGWAILGVGVLLEAAGAAWMRALLRPR
ncbi:MAG TPA: type II secretion system F family protein [Actinomycetota bacterium]